MRTCARAHSRGKREAIQHMMSCIMHHASCIMHHASCIMHHASCIMHHASCIIQKFKCCGCMHTLVSYMPTQCNAISCNSMQRTVSPKLLMRCSSFIMHVTAACKTLGDIRFNNTFETQFYKQRLTNTWGDNVKRDVI
jgi:hypothetical protein